MKTRACAEALKNLYDAAIAAGYAYDSDTSYVLRIKNFVIDLNKYDVVIPGQIYRESDEAYFENFWESRDNVRMADVRDCVTRRLK